MLFVLLSHGLFQNSKLAKHLRFCYRPFRARRLEVPKSSFVYAII